MSRSNLIHFRRYSLSDAGPSLPVMVYERRSGKVIWNSEGRDRTYPYDQGLAIALALIDILNDIGDQRRDPEPEET